MQVKGRFDHFNINVTDLEKSRSKEKVTDLNFFQRKTSWINQLASS